ncbi:MAG: ABC transporter ATP-binding protein [Deltaproteobacteria bacterium]|nr:ABC transporter ATP-binding protein [Deltaproteobacteria bacterium]
MLSLEKVTSGYIAGIDILRDVSIEVKKGAVTGVIGPNGAGKSTMLKTVFGFMHPRSGRILFEGREVQNYPYDRLKQMGISFMLQEHSVFPQLNVQDNLLLGAWTFRKDRSIVKQRLKEVYDLFPMLLERHTQKANHLSGGLLRMLCIGKEIMTKPKLLMLDEPSAGLAPKVVTEIYALIRKIAESGTTILLVDQNIMKAVEVSDYMYLLEMGQVKQHGAKKEFEKSIRDIIRDSFTGS